MKSLFSYSHWSQSRLLLIGWFIVDFSFTGRAAWRVINNTELGNCDEINHGVKEVTDKVASEAEGFERATVDAPFNTSFVVLIFQGINLFKLFLFYLWGIFHLVLHAVKPR